MTRLQNLLAITVALTISMIFFMGRQPSDTALIGFLLNPSNWSNLSLIGQVSTVLGLAGAASVIASTVFKNELLFYGGIGLVFLSFGGVFYEYWVILAGDPFLANIFGDNSSIMVMILFAPLLVAWTLTILEFARGRD